MLIDCDTCSVRGVGCDDCVVAVILNRGADPVELDDSETYAVGQLAEAGLLPPLRLVRDSREKTGSAVNFGAGSLKIRGIA